MDRHCGAVLCSSLSLFLKFKDLTTLESNPFRLSQKGRRFRGPDFPAYRNTPCYRQAPIKSAIRRICPRETGSLASAKAAVGSTHAMLGRLSEPNKDSDPAIDGLQRPLRSTFRDFRFLRAWNACHNCQSWHAWYSWCAWYAVRSWNTWHRRRLCRIWYGWHRCYGWQQQHLRHKRRIRYGWYHSHICCFRHGWL